MHGQIAAFFPQRAVQLADEEAASPDLIQRPVLNPIALRLHGNQLQLRLRAERLKRLHRQPGLRDRQRALPAGHTDTKRSRIREIRSGRGARRPQKTSELARRPPRQRVIRAVPDDPGRQRAKTGDPREIKIRSPAIVRQVKKRAAAFRIFARQRIRLIPGRG